MNNISQFSYKKCFSCRSCEQICPKSAVTLSESAEGFYYPIIDNEKCINCSLCVKSCPVLSPVKNDISNQKSYVAYLKDKELLKRSTSGGAFTGFAENILSNNGYVFGAAYDDNLVVKQTCVSNFIDLEKLKGSKYVACDTENSFSQVKQLLKTGKKVLYSGTPCQIAGLRDYLSEEYDNLITVDLICHGVPSQKLFNKYLEWQGKKSGGKIIYCGFRDKDIGGWSCGGKIKTKTKTKTKTINGSFDPYYRSFLKCNNYKESCYTCPFAKMENRPSDITIGDFFEVNLFFDDIDRANGVSLIITNTQRGYDFFNSVRNKFEIFNIESKQYLHVKGNLSSPSPRPELRDRFYKNIDSLSASEFWEGFEEVHILYKLKFYLKKIISIILPKCMKQILNQHLFRRAK